MARSARGNGLAGMLDSRHPRRHRGLPWDVAVAEMLNPPTWLYTLRVRNVAPLASACASGKGGKPRMLLHTQRATPRGKASHSLSDSGE